MAALDAQGAACSAVRRRTVEIGGERFRDLLRQSAHLPVEPISARISRDLEVVRRKLKDPGAGPSHGSGIRPPRLTAPRDARCPRA